MIDITKLSDKDVGRWVVYKDDTASREVGKIKSWNKIRSWLNKQPISRS